MHTLDLLGVNYYTRTVVKYDPKFPLMAAAQVQPEGMNIPACGKSIRKASTKY